MTPTQSHFPPLIILDANIVIEAFELNVWELLVAKYQVTLLSDVVQEASFYEDEKGEQHRIDLTPWVTAGKIKVESVSLEDVKHFIGKTDKSYYDRIHPGELASLTFLFKNQDSYLIVSSDNIIYKTLGRFNIGDKGLSFEVMLKKIGLTKKLDLQFTEKFRSDCTQQGDTDFIYGFKA